MTKVLVLQHAAQETLGTIADALAERSIEPEVVATFDGAKVPRTMAGAAGIVVMGGPMGVYELARYPFLRDELGLLGDALRAGKPILGVCLGSQLLATALGGQVKKGPRKEIGWHTVHLSGEAGHDPAFAGIAQEFAAFHWHGDQFDLPPGASALASSAITPYQAFRHGRASYGVLFHLEMTRAIIESMVVEFADELREAEVDAGVLLGETERYLAGMHAIGEKVFGSWADQVAGSRA